jgi:hypothetical protein
MSWIVGFWRLSFFSIILMARKFAKCLWCRLWYCGLWFWPIADVRLLGFVWLSMAVFGNVLEALVLRYWL